MSVTVYTRGMADTRFGRLRLGDPIPTAPACDECRRPAALELAGRDYCAPCLEHVVEYGLGVIAGDYTPAPE